MNSIPLVVQNKNSHQKTAASIKYKREENIRQSANFLIAQFSN